MPAQDKNNGEKTNLLHLEKYLKGSTNTALKTCLQMIILPQTKTLCPTRARGVILFKTYNKDKPAKYGLNFRDS